MRHLRALFAWLLFGKPVCHLTYHGEASDDVCDYWIDAHSETLGDYEQIGFVRGYNPYHMIDLGRVVKKRFPFHTYLICDYGGKVEADFTKPLLFQDED